MLLIGITYKLTSSELYFIISLIQDCYSMHREHWITKALREKCSNMELILVRIFQYSD